MNNTLIRTNSPLNFGKFCVDTCTILRNNAPYECRIYELEYDKDKKILKNWKPKRIGKTIILLIVLINILTIIMIKNILS